MAKSLSSSFPVVLVDDEPSVLFSSKALLKSAGIKDVETIEDSRDVMPRLTKQEAAVVVLDLSMPYISGGQLLPEIVKEYPDLPVIVMTASQGVDTAVASMKEGAFDYLVKPVEESRFISGIKRALEVRRLREQVSALKQYLISDNLEHGDVFASIITRSRKMRALFQYMEAIAGSTEPVLISGETGVGKELLSEAVHRLSGRSGKFIQVNVAGLDDTLFSDSLFGHKKGAFTGAEGAREGLVAQAAGGTLFLDEIGDLKAGSQVKLLRLLQEQQYYPLGSDVAKISDVRLICATNWDLRRRMTKKRFRSDLYFRLSVHEIDVPPLRERKEDLPILAGHFLKAAARSMDKPMSTPPQELFTLLAAYHFPGNVRELRAMIHDAVASHRSGPVLSMESFRKAIKVQHAAAGSGKESSGGGIPPFLGNIEGRFPTLKEAETLLIEEALRRAEGNQGIAATMLGISRPALNRRLARSKD